ncbi:hypothetical protein GOBAR_DD28358 [Gossypium barbadense]|nr:hypothetical protein GOBAR_DD28358 [Gossypium barbadense]
MKVKVVCRKLYDYVQYDLKEIAFPSSLPDPPHIKKRRKLTWHERFLVLKEASRLYAASWSHYSDDHTVNLCYLAIAARGGMETLRPALQRLYMTRASAYRDALKSFIEGYQESIRHVMEEKEDSTKVQLEGNWIGKPFGSIIFSNKGGFVYLLALTLEL